MNTEIEREKSLERLREMIRPGATIYVLLRHKNPLGTARWLEFYAIHENQLKCVTWDIAHAIGGVYCRKHDALKVTGSGLDAGFASVDLLGDALFGTGRTLKHKWL